MPFGQSLATAINPVGQEIGGLIASLIQLAIDGQYTKTGPQSAFSLQGIKGTNPAQFVTPDIAILGTKTVKQFVDNYTDIPFDDSAYPNQPLFYEYQQRDNYFVWRKQRALNATPPDYILTIGKDAVLDGEITRYPVYSDAMVLTADGKTKWAHSDLDTSRRWDGRRFWTTDRTSSSFLDAAQSKAVRIVEVFKNERISFTLDTTENTFILYPGDLVRIDNGESVGIVSQNYRVSEVQMSFAGGIHTKITVGDPAVLLTNFL